MTRGHLLLSAAAIAALSGCGGSGGDTQEAPGAARTATISGTLAYRERIALPPEAEALVEVIAEPGGPVAGSTRFALGDRSVPVPFEVAADSTDPGATVSVHGAFLVDGAVRWLGRADGIALVDGEATNVAIMARGFAPGPVTATFACSAADVGFAPEAPGAAMVIGEETFALRSVRAASGSKYEAIGVPDTSFWTRGDSAMITVRGEDLGECTQVNNGNEASNPGEIVGGEWVIEDIGGGGIIDRSRVTVSFTEDGRVAGLGSCNRYMGTYDRTEGSITFSPLAATMMACPEALMNQEQKFFAIMNEVTSLSIDETGALVLATEDGRTILARRG